ncbi:MAG TPA: sigma 54-interacting transcriptional regulator [Pyrinomonadaceae bacterium]|nr:sigma 54-interacting transcriptional regulator [Pyrinomonadaceae bacterium]
MHSGEFQLAELTAQLAVPGLGREQYRTLLGLQKAISSHRNIPDLFRDLACRLQQLFKFRDIGVMLHDEARNTMRLYVLEACEGVLREPVTEVPIEGSIAGWVWQNQEPVIVSDLQNESRFPGTASLRPYQAKSMCSLPLTTAHQRLGALNVWSEEAGAYDELDLEFAQLVATQIAVAVDNALHFQEAQLYQQQLAKERDTLRLMLEENAQAYREIDALKNKLEEEKLYLEEEISNEFNFREIIGCSPTLKRALQAAQTVASTDSNVLIFGETGTGKELIARAIHNLSLRREHTLVRVNCAAIPTGLLESEMFGHEKGAFTGAIEQRKGRFELAHKGTLFLDEVEDIPLDLQPKLLRVLQEQEFERLGSSRTITVDVRVVAATNTDLAELVGEKKFRSDLFYRLNVFPITLPPLRERTEDIPLLVHFFTQKFAKRMKKPVERIPTEIMTALTRYSWPGNIRELQNLIERAVILTRGTVLEVPLGELKQSGKVVAEPTGTATLEAVEREHILRVLGDTNWVIATAATRLGLPRTTLNNKMQKLGISRARR